MARESWRIDEDKLTLHEKLGKGGYGEVYRAELETPEGVQIVAAKKLLVGEIDATQNKELSILQRMNHPNVVKFIGATITQDNHLVLITDFAVKGSLRDYLENLVKGTPNESVQNTSPPDFLITQSEYLPNSLFFKWAIQASLAVRYIQQEDVIHRDIKSPNFVITKEDDLQLCDFGIAKEAIETKSTTNLKGTARWMAPENYTYDNPFRVSPRSDIFSLALVIWEMIKGEKPFAGYEDHWIIFKVGNEGRRPDIPGRVSPAIRNLLKQCWEADNKKRPKIDMVIDVFVEEWLRSEGNNSFNETYINNNILLQSVLTNVPKCEIVINSGKKAQPSVACNYLPHCTKTHNLSPYPWYDSKHTTFKRTTELQ